MKREIICSLSQLLCTEPYIVDLKETTPSPNWRVSLTFQTTYCPSNAAENEISCFQNLCRGMEEAVIDTALNTGYSTGKQVLGLFGPSCEHISIPDKLIDHETFQEIF